MSIHNTSSIDLYCAKTMMSENLDINFKEGIKKTTYHPIFKMKVDFGDSKDTKTAVCPHCKKQVKYKSFRTKFSLKKHLLWTGVIIIVSVLLFFSGMFLYIFGGWELDLAISCFSVWGLMGFILGMVLLVFQLMRYFATYRKNKYRYRFILIGGRLLGGDHFMTNHTRAASWKHPPA